MGSWVSASQWGYAPLAEHEAGVGCPPSLSPQAHRVHRRVLRMSSQQLCGCDLCPARDNACEAPGGTQAGTERSRPSARGRGEGGRWRETREQGRSCGRLPLRCARARSGQRDRRLPSHRRSFCTPFFTLPSPLLFRLGKSFTANKPRPRLMLPLQALPDVGGNGAT